MELLAAESGLPVGIKSAVGELGLFRDLASLMATGRGVDFVNIDGGEGGTGAGPLVFADHVALPFKIAFSRVYRIFAEAGLTDDVVFTGAGKLGLPERVAAVALGCDTINVGRRRCSRLVSSRRSAATPGDAPTGVTEQRVAPARPRSRSEVSARGRYLVQARKELLQLAHAYGEVHPRS